MCSSSVAQLLIQNNSCSLGNGRACLKSGPSCFPDSPYTCCVHRAADEDPWRCPGTLGTSASPQASSLCTPFLTPLLLGVSVSVKRADRTELTAESVHHAAATYFVCYEWSMSLSTSSQKHERQWFLPFQLKLSKAVREASLLSPLHTLLKVKAELTLYLYFLEGRGLTGGGSRVTWMRYMNF